MQHIINITQVLPHSQTLARHLLYTTVIFSTFRKVPQKTRSLGKSPRSVTPPPTQYALRTQLVVVIRPFDFRTSSNPALTIMDLQSVLLSYFAHYGQVCMNIHISCDFLLNGKKTDTRIFPLLFPDNTLV